MKLGYLIKRVFGMNFGQLKTKLKEVHDKSSKSYIVLIFDMINCAVRYQAGYMDYALFEMYDLNREQRKTVVTRGINNGFIKKYNDPAYGDLFDNKILFSKRFAEFVRRDWVDINAADEKTLEDFIKKHPVFIAKPADGMCGKGIERISTEDFDGDDLVKYLKEKNLVLLEECVVQHEKMSRLYPDSVNTCRVITLNHEGRVSVIAAYLRIGNGKHVDNFNSGGMVVPVDKESGVIRYPALDKSGKTYHTHPRTNVDISGFEIPMWDKVVSLTKQAATVVPQVGLVGWDVAVCDDEPLLIEGNNFPGHDIYGLPVHRTNGIGVLPEFEKAMGKK